MPSPLKKIQERLIPDGNIENLLITNAFLSSGEKYTSTLGLETEVMDGEYKGEPVTDFLHIQESKHNPGELYISRNGKMHRVLVNALTKAEFNALADALAKVEPTREAWIEVIAEALNKASNPAFRSVVTINEPEDEANLRNKLTRDPDEIGKYMPPEEVEETRKQAQAIKDRLMGNGQKED